MLAILFAVQKFYFFVYKYQFRIENDHKPLEFIFKKPLQALSPRLQRMQLKLLNYSLTVSYKPEKKCISQMHYPGHI